MTNTLALSDREFKITMINLLRALKKKIDNMQEQIVNILRETETLKSFRKKY